MIKHKHSFVICYILPKLLYQNCGFGTFGIQRMYLKTLLSYGWYWILFRASLHSFCLWSKETFIPALGPWVIKANSRSLQNQKQTSDFFFLTFFFFFFFTTADGLTEIEGASRVTAADRSLQAVAHTTWTACTCMLVCMCMCVSMHGFVVHDLQPLKHTINQKTSLKLVF